MSDRETQLYRVIELAQAGNLADAAGILDGLLAANPDDPDANSLRATIYMATHQAAEALPLFARAAPAKQGDPAFLYNYARALLACGRPSEAEAPARAAFDAAPGNPDLAMTLAACLRSQGREAEAEAALRPAAEAAPTMPLLNELGLCLVEQDRLPEAEAAFRRAVEIAPDAAPAWHNLGNLALDRQRPDDALAAFDRALAIDPEHPESHVHRAQALLLSGRYADGWDEYEWRWRLPQALSPRADLTTPLWDGSPFDGRRLLIYAEQGMGDNLQFARFLPLAAARGGRVIADIPRPLHRLLAAQNGDYDLCIQDGPPPPHDLRLPMMSLPRVLGIGLDDLPGPAPYIAAPDDPSWDDRLATRPGRPRVGLVWRALAEKRGSALRSVPLEAMAPLFGLPDVAWVSLQKEIAEADRPLPEALLDVSASLGDFADTAALINELDLVVTVDTAVAHLAGAMGRPVWVLLPHGNDWRWLTGRDDSPWYPSARLYRQDAGRDWAAVIAAVAEDLAGLGR